MTKPLAEWQACIDDYDSKHVYCTMIACDGTSDWPESIGTFPRHLLSHIPLRVGLILSVTVTHDEQVVISTVPAERREPTNIFQPFIDMIRALRKVSHDR